MSATSEEKKQEIVAKGRQWFELVREDFEQMVSPTDTGETCFFLIVGLLGQAADLDDMDEDIEPDDDWDDDDPGYPQEERIV